MSLRGLGLWLIGQLVDELRLAKARPGPLVTLHRRIGDPAAPANCRDGPVAGNLIPRWLPLKQLACTAIVLLGGMLGDPGW